MNKRPVVPEIIDTHVHITDPAFDDDRDEVIARAANQGVTRLINPGSDLESSRAAVDFAQLHPNIFAAVGLHPHALLVPDLESAYKEIEQLAKDPKVVAIGEFGLDLKHEGSDLTAQQEVFRRQTALAKKTNLPIILHCRAMYDDLIKLVKTEAKGLPGVVHSFAGDAEQLKQLVELGYYIAFGGIVTFDKRTEALREAAKVVPLNRLLLETDAPYLTPVPRRGKRNEPAEVVTIAQFIADLRQISYAELAQATTLNAEHVFKLNG